MLIVQQTPARDAGMDFIHRYLQRADAVARHIADPNAHEVIALCRHRNLLPERQTLRQELAVLRLGQVQRSPGDERVNPAAGLVVHNRDEFDQTLASAIRRPRQAEGAGLGLDRAYAVKTKYTPDESAIPTNDSRFAAAMTPPLSFSAGRC